MRCLPQNNNNPPSWTWQLHATSPAPAHNLQVTNKTATPMQLPSPTTPGQSVSSYSLRERACQRPTND